MNCTICHIPRQTYDVESYYNATPDFIVGLTYQHISLCKKDILDILSIINDFEEDRYDGPFTITFNPENICIETRSGYQGMAKICPPSKMAGPKDDLSEYLPEYNIATRK